MVNHHFWENMFGTEFPFASWRVANPRNGGQAADATRCASRILCVVTRGRMAEIHGIWRKVVLSVFSQERIPMGMIYLPKNEWLIFMVYSIRNAKYT